MWKECNIHLLPSKKKSRIIKINSGKLTLYEDELLTENQGVHLYITDDSEIKEGDWILHKLDEYPTIVTNRPEYSDKTKLKEYGYKKIIATTDTSLSIKYDGNSPISENWNKQLPQIPQQFIEYYISEYNKGRKIEKVLVEFEEYCVESFGLSSVIGYDEPATDYRLKISPTNEISIKPVEEIVLTWKQAKLMLSTFICEYAPETSSKFNAGIYLNNWIKENLKL